MLAAGDLPIPTNIPPWMGVAMFLVWAAVVVGAVTLFRIRRASRSARRRSRSGGEFAGKKRQIDRQLESGD